MRKLGLLLSLTALAVAVTAQSAFAAVDYTPLTDGLTTKIESGITSALPVLAVIIGATLVVKMIRRFVRG